MNADLPRSNAKRNPALHCGMSDNCTGAVSHVDEAGYVYCAHHGAQRKYDKRTRKLRHAEIKKLERGEVISYRPARRNPAGRDWAAVEQRIEEMVSGTTDEAHRLMMSGQAPDGV